MSDEPRLSSEDLDAEAGTALPNKEVISLLDLNVDLDAALDLAAPIDLAVAANANVAAPINAAVSANVLSIGSESAAMATQHGTIDQGISGDAIANAPQTSSIDQGNDVIDDGGTAAPVPPTDGTGGVTAPTPDPQALLDGDLLNIDLDAALDLAAPIDLAVAANANVAAPINAAVSANVLSIGSESAAMATQSGTIDQGISGEAIANAPQDSTIDQSNDVIDGGTTTTPTDAGTVTAPTPSPEALLDGDLLNIDANVGIDADIAAPVAGAVAANANVAAPIDAAVSANVASAASSSAALADQDVAINQHLDDVTAEANADQTSDITQ